jgi:hypothetical protein
VHAPGRAANAYDPCLHTHACTQAPLPPPQTRQTHVRTHARTHAHARARTHTHTYTHTHTHTHTYTHTAAPKARNPLGHWNAPRGRSPDVECADALGRAKLVAHHRQQVYAQRPDVHRDLRRRGVGFCGVWGVGQGQARALSGSGGWGCRPTWGVARAAIGWGRAVSAGAGGLARRRPASGAPRRAGCRGRRPGAQRARKRARLAERLRGVGVQQRAGAGDGRCDLGDGLDRPHLRREGEGALHEAKGSTKRLWTAADRTPGRGVLGRPDTAVSSAPRLPPPPRLVVRVHYADEDGLGRHRRRHIRRADEALGVDADGREASPAVGGAGRAGRRGQARRATPCDTKQGPPGDKTPRERLPSPAAPLTCRAPGRPAPSGTLRRRGAPQPT